VSERREADPVLRAISPSATPEEVAAILAAITAADAQRRAAAGGPEPTGRSAWVDVSRLSTRRAGMLRGSWRLSGRIGRRARV